MPAAARWPDILGNVPEFVFTPRAQHSIMRSRLDNTRISTEKYYLGCTHFLDRNRLFRIGRTSDIFVEFLFPAAQSMGVRLWISKTRSKAQIQISKKLEGPTLNSKPWSKVRIWISSTCSKVRLWTSKTLPGPNLNFEKKRWCPNVNF